MLYFLTMDLAWINKDTDSGTTSEKLSASSTIVADPKLLVDLMNMGFSKEESEAALVSVANKSIELAIDKVFENQQNKDVLQEAAI